MVYVYARAYVDANVGDEDGHAYGGLVMAMSGDYAQIVILVLEEEEQDGRRLFGSS